LLRDNVAFGGLADVSHALITKRKWYFRRT